MSNTQLASLTLANLAALYNGAVSDYAPSGFGEVDRFKSKAHAIERIEALCEAGSLAIAFDGAEAVIVDAMETPSGDELREANADDYDREYDSEGEGEGEGEGDTPAPLGAHLSDAKGGIARSGFAYGSEEWLLANPRGTAAREAYRTARRKAARAMRKAGRAIA